MSLFSKSSNRALSIDVFSRLQVKRYMGVVFGGIPRQTF